MADEALALARRWLPPEQPSPWKTRGSRRIYENPWISVQEDDVLGPDGQPTIYGVVQPTHLALGVVPIDSEDYTWLVGQYRYPLGLYSWEIPEGGGDPQADPRDEAARELREETGLIAHRLDHLMTLHTSNCYTAERAEIYVGRELEPGPADPDPSEDLQICRLPLTAAVTLARGGVITDAMSVAALLRLAD